jgi:TatD DNase family protein
MQYRYFDAHSHVTFKDYDQDLPEVLKRMEESQVGTITVGVDYATSKEAVAFAQANKGFYATIGLHPSDTPAEGFDEQKFAELVDDPKVVGIGECGLDYFRISGDIVAEKKRQREAFEKQIQFAITHLKPLMLHCRPSKGSMDAYEDVLDMLEPLKGQVAGNVHFFVGSVDVVRRFYNLNFSTSFTGVLTFAREYDEVVRFAPVDMMLTETDSPYATPNPFRGRRNEPVYVKYVVSAIAQITGLPEEKLREQIVENAVRVFGLGKVG